MIVPTYNNHLTLEAVLHGVRKYCDDIIVVNDGSTDNTAALLEKIPDLRVITHTHNQGKGVALRNAFKLALDMGFDYAITIDSDGQHFPEDIPRFLDVLKQREEPILLIGARNMDQEGIPKKSSFGNKFSNFWFWFETGIRLEDTQSGFRLYPLKEMPKKYFTPKFEFEIESIVRAAWKGVTVENIPIQVHYEQVNRVSHFRPFRDFTRISILNTVLVTLSLLYIKPREFFRNLKKKDLKQFLKDEVLESKAPPSTKAFSMALGVFWGIVPLWGFQTMGVLGSAYILRLNKLIAFAFSNVSLPPFIPLIIWASVKVGALFVSGPALSGKPIALEEHLAQYLVGASVLALTLGALTGTLAYLLLITRTKAAVNA